METTPAGWTVIDRDAAVLTIPYEFAPGATATTFVARLPDGTLWVVSPATGLSDAAFDELSTFGEVGAILANNGSHYLGQAVWRERYPQARCFAAPGAAARIATKDPTLGAFEPLEALEPLLGDHLGVRGAPAAKAGETWCWAKIDGGFAWYASDVLIHLEALPKAWVPRFLFWASGSAPGFRVFHLALRFGTTDKAALLRQLLSDLADHPPTVIVPAHGSVIARGDLAAEARRIIEAAL